MANRVLICTRQSPERDPLATLCLDKVIPQIKTLRLLALEMPSSPIAVDELSFHEEGSQVRDITLGPYCAAEAAREVDGFSRIFPIGLLKTRMRNESWTRRGAYQTGARAQATPTSPASATFRERPRSPRRGSVPQGGRFARDCPHFFWGLFSIGILCHLLHHLRLPMSRGVRWPARLEIIPLLDTRPRA